MASRPPEHVPPTAQERNRFVVINVIRLSGAALILIGILIVNGAIDLPQAGACTVRTWRNGRRRGLKIP